MTKTRKQIKGHYLGLPYESNEELYFLYWCEELIRKQIILPDIERGKTFVLSEPATEEIEVIKQLKKGIKKEIKYKKFLREHIYTNDFTIYIKEDKINLFDFKYAGNKIVNEISYLRAYFEIKPVYDQNNMTRIFNINQKWVFDKYGQFINLFVPEKEFIKRFFPKKYLFTRTGKARNTNLLNSQIKINLINDFL
jgi:hypothetical protein